VGQVVNLRRIGNPPAGTTHNSKETLAPLAAMWGSQSWLQPAFSRLAPAADALVSPQETQASPEHDFN